jgi:hypothetical protein
MKDEVTREWRRHLNELHDHHSSKHSSDQVENNEMGGACGEYGLAERFIQGFGGEN